MDRKCAVYGERPARIESFREELFPCRWMTLTHTRTNCPSGEIISQARGVPAPVNHVTLAQMYSTIEHCKQRHAPGNWLLHHVPPDRQVKRRRPILFISCSLGALVDARTDCLPLTKALDNEWPPEPRWALCIFEMRFSGAARSNFQSAPSPRSDARNS